MNETRTMRKMCIRVRVQRPDQREHVTIPVPDLEAQLCGLDGADVASGAAADDSKIIFRAS
jgi:hypothetical protein